MITTIRTYIIGAIAASLIIGFAYLKWELYSVQKEYSEYKLNIEQQVAINKSRAEQTKIEQDSKYAKAKTDYDNAQSALDLALARLRHTRDMPREESVRVAGCSCGTMPAEAGNTGGIVTTAEIEAGIRKTAFYSDAMKDILQCHKLIEFVR